MKNVVAVFPDATSMADFILDNSISNAVVNSKDHILTTQLTDQQIVLASTKYQAYMKSVKEWCLKS